MRREQMSEVEYFSHFITDGNGKLREVLQRRGKTDGVFVDWLTVTFHEDTLVKAAGHPLVSDNEYMYVLSRKLEEILGFGITRKCKSKGNKFYEMMFRLGSESVDYGEVHYGGQRGTVLIELKGVGCSMAKEGWEARMFDFLQQAIRPRITRIDLAIDFFNGEYTPEQAEIDHDNGFFDNHNMRPKSERKGTAWRKEDGTGKTFYIGRLKNSRYVRVYEKGRQLGDKDSKWVRFEIQFNHGDIDIPNDILIDEGSYFCGAFPICASFQNMPEAKRFDTVKKVLNKTFDHKLKHGKNAVGKLVNFMVDVGLSAEEIVEMLKAESGYPTGLEPERYSLDELRYAERSGYLHDNIRSDEELNTDWLDFRVSDDFDPNKRLLDIEGDISRQRKEADDFEAFVERKLEELEPLEKRLDRIARQEAERMRRIRLMNAPYRWFYGRFVTYRKTPEVFNHCFF